MHEVARVYDDEEFLMVAYCMSDKAISGGIDKLHIQLCIRIEHVIKCPNDDNLNSIGNLFHVSSR